MNCCDKCGYWNRELLFNGKEKICLSCGKMLLINKEWEEYYNSQEKPESTPTVSFKLIADIREFKRGELHYYPRKKCQKAKRDKTET